MLFVIVALLLLPVLEIAVMIQVGSWLGGWEMLALLLMVTFLGVWIVKQQGIGAWSRIRGDLAAGQVPGVAIIDGALLLTAGVLFLIPGFVTDVVAVLLLVPPIRAACRGVLSRRFRVVAALHTAGVPADGWKDGGWNDGGWRDGAYDVESHVRPQRRPPTAPPELGA